MKEEEIKRGHVYMVTWSVLSDVVKYVQYNQYTIGHYKLDVKTTEERYGTRMHKRLQNSEREIMKVNYDSNVESLKQEFLDIFKGVKSDVMYTA